MTIYIVSFTAEMGGVSYPGIKDQTLVFSNEEAAEYCVDEFGKSYGEMSRHIRVKKVEILDNKQKMLLTTWDGTVIE